MDQSLVLKIMKEISDSV